MSNFEVLIYKIKEPVINHPDADRLSLIQIEGYTCISAKFDDGSHRYKQGDLVVYIPEGAELPSWMMKYMDFWDNNKDKPSFKYVKAKKLRGIFSQGILYPVKYHNDGNAYVCIENNDKGLIIEEGTDATEYLGITKYQPVTPASMQGKVSGQYIAHTMKYDFDSIQKNKNMFEFGETVYVTEKLHGTLIQIGIIPNLDDPELFHNNIFVTSKGIGKQGFVYKNFPENDGNLYVKILKSLNQDTLQTLSKSKFSIHLFGEVFGPGVQDLHYGQSAPTFRLFDVAIDKCFLNNEPFLDFANLHNIPTVPLVYKGPFDYTLIEKLRDGKDIISETNIREGIVIKSDNIHPHLGRKIAKFVSPDYLLRRGNTTEFE